MLGSPPPVAFFIFRRPDLTRRVFAAIREARPPRLFVFADGPRTPDEAALCAQARAVIDVDWPCEVVTDFADRNLGLRQRLVSGISAVFEQADEAIFLEDDCLPHPTFFRFCGELLEKYRNEPRVMHISGDCFVPTNLESSFYFTRYAHIWGWASWRRAWAQYDARLAGWNDPLVRETVLARCSSDPERAFWTMILPQVQSGKVNTWDYQWAFTLLKSSALAINPSLNLVRNIGFGANSTHTKDAGSAAAKQEFRAMEFPLIPPDEVAADSSLDDQIAGLFFTYTPRRFEDLRQRWYRIKHKFGISP